MQLQDRQDTTIQYLLPKWVIDYLITRDVSSFVEDEIDVINDFLATENLTNAKGYWIYDPEKYKSCFPGNGTVECIGIIEWIEQKP